MDTPLVTIGIPTFNRADSFLDSSLNSALAQTYDHLEIIVSDNCSKDGTGVLVSGKRDPRIRYHKHDPAVRPEENADYCLREAKGKYFLLLHDDDLLDADFIESCISAIGNDDPGMARTGARKIDGNGSILAIKENPHASSTVFEFFDAVIRGEAVTFFCNTLYHTERLRKAGGFHSKTYTYQDIAATLKMAAWHKRIDIPEPKASYRIHGDKLGQAMDLRRWCEDSVYLIDLMCELMPEKEAYFRSEGIKIRCRRSYLVKAKKVNLLRRPFAYFVVYRSFGRGPMEAILYKFRQQWCKLRGLPFE